MAAEEAGILPMARKIILDMDPGVDDAAALCVALAAPEVEVIAVTATGGNVTPSQATRNVQAIVERTDPDRWPRIGAASPEQILRTDGRHFFGVDGFCGAHFEVAELHHQHASVKVISDQVHAAPGEVTIVATGPVSNIAAALQREPTLATQIGHLIILGGTIGGPGNVTPAAEFNIYCDAAAARQVFHSPITKTLIPIDVTSKVVFGLDLLNYLPDENSRTGRLLRALLPGAFRVYRQQLGLEVIHLHDVVAVVAAIHPELFTTRPMYGDVETEGQLTHGATVFDRRQRPEDPPNMEVAVDVDTAGVKDCILRVLAMAN
jgi:purine nucleosidase